MVFRRTLSENFLLNFYYLKEYLHFLANLKQKIISAVKKTHDRLSM